MTSTTHQFPEISGYTITEQIYLGSRTAVYRAVQDKQQLPVVIKVLQREYPTFGELVQFRNQYAIAKNLPIAGIIPPLSLEQFGNGYALVMADWGGISLEKYIQQQLDLTQKLAIAIQLADILHELYSCRVIHKDIKPANILIHPESQQVKLIDFSIASLLPKETQEIQNPNVLEGTLAYLAPEQTGRMNRGIDYRSDFYAFGVTLYQLFTNCLPFITDDPLELVHCHIAKIATPVDQVNTDVPKMLGAIVAKLMAKNAEDRYQSALGIKHDLQFGLNQWKQTGSITEFALGQRDLCDRLLIPEKLYGREAEVQALLDAFERVATGASELMLVAGFSGIGKTAVINEVHKPILKQRGYFIKGKFDQFNRNIPFSAFVQAFRDLIGQLLSESDTQLQTWKTQILAALGENAQVIIELIPELKRIIGNQPPAPELSGTAAQNRFNLLFQRFIRVFTTTEHPLVMFLDDLQWADSASLNLIQVLMSEVKTGCLLLLGAYRDNEVFAAHPLMLTLNGMEKAGATIHTITLQTLNFTSLNHLIADTLHAESELVKPLTELVIQKTQGNPFFATQFLKALHQEQLITFDRNAGHWQCDIVQVRDAALTDDVVEFMALQLQKLPESTQEILKLAACVGAQFDLETLAIVSEQFQTEVATTLWKALQEGLILPQSELYKFYLGEAQTTENQPNETLNYKFLHDRIQQAAYSLIPDDQKQVTHLTIGKLLLKNSNPSFQDSHLFEIVHQLNCGISLITELDQRYQYAQLNLQAGYKAKDSTAYNAALDYCNTGIQFLPTDSWDKNYNLTRYIYELAAEVALLSCNFEQMDTLIQIVLKNTNNLLEQVKIYEIKLQAYQVQNQQMQAIKIGREILQKLGVILPESITLSDIQQQVQHTLTQLSNYTFEDLINLPITQNATATAAGRIMTSLVPSIHQANPLLFPIIACEEVNLSLQYGNSPFSAPGYADFGIIVNSVLNQIEVGYRFGQLALQLMEKFNQSSVLSMVLFKVAAFNQSNQQNIRNAISLLNKSYQVSIETGDSVHALVSTSFRLFYSYLSGEKSLPDLLEEVEVYQSKFATSQHFLSWVHIIRSSIHNFIELSDNPDCLGSIDTENKQLSILLTENDELALHLFYLSKLILSYSFGCFETAIQIADRGVQYLKAGTSMPSAPAYYYYDSLTRLKLYSNLQPSSEEELLSKVDSNQKNLLVYVNAAPMNYQHKYYLVEAVRLHGLGKRVEALEFFDRAIAGAKANGYIQEEALANELAAKFYLDWGKEKVASGYMQEAYYCYSRWGAKAKIHDLEQRYPKLLRPILQQAEVSSGILNTVITISPLTASISSNSHKSSNNTTINQALDFAAILKASQALSSTIELDRLLNQLTQIILQNSGGDRCALILPDETGEWEVRAIATPEDTKLCAEPLANNPNLPVKFIQYVKNTQEIVVINELKTDLPVIDDYLRQRQPKSLLCLPLLNQGQLIGILYLKNHFTVGAFTRERVEVLNFLCTQAAISLKNAQLYQQEQRKSHEIAQKEAEYRSIFENVNDGLSIVDLTTGKAVAVNPTMCQMHGYTLEEWSTVQPGDFIHESCLHEFANFIEVLNRGEEFYTQALDVSKDGHIFDVEVKAVPFMYQGKIHALSIVRDISDRKQAENALRQKSQELEQALIQLQNTQLQVVQSEKMASLGNLVAGVAHEINNPIGFLNGSINNAKEYVQDLLKHLEMYQEQQPPNDLVQESAEEIDLEFLSSDLPKLLDAMKGATNRIKSISTSLRTFSRADTDHKVSANLHEGLDSTLLILKYRLKANEHRPAIEVTNDYGDLPTIECFPGQLNQVFMNILANAIDMFDEMAQTQSFKELEANPQKITIRTSIESNQVHIRIRDNGKGMSDDVQAKIFDHLFTTKEVGKGTGLGLAIARQIVVEKHSGSLNVWSELGQGTEFCISLPIGSA
ncbi:AAA family ATPase [Halotia branconii]|uniref:histidine kinase n=1 Tax=Halotia branconii CENA392 TaxID=1539056 RepID=A0AAJ6P770_9CYAN|nr:AAA family ATPase [Halotia branconii]WGV23321.1 AAA family ATPase [Halotia branconii CENA392]